MVRRRYQIDDSWRERVVARMAELGLSKADLMRALKVSDATISHLIGEGNEPGQRWVAKRSWHSSHVPAIHRALRWAPPPESSETAREPDTVIAELRTIAEELGDSQRQLLLELAREMKRKL